MTRSLLAMLSLTTAVNIASATPTLPQIIDFPPETATKPDVSRLTPIQKCALTAAESISIPSSHISLNDANREDDKVRVLKTRSAAIKTGDLNAAIVLNRDTPQEHRIVGYSSHDIGVDVTTKRDTDGKVYVHFKATHEGSYYSKPDALVGSIFITVSPEGKTIKREGIVASLDIQLRGKPEKLPHYEWTKQAVQSMEYEFTKCANIEMAPRPPNAVKSVTVEVPYKAGAPALELGLIR
jgi:hypothetical protein